jgi:hypothetical protein
MAKKVNFSLDYSVLPFVAIFVLAVLVIKKSLRENFGASQPGTRVQLSTSHVYTREEVDNYRSNCGKQVRSDITNMTGADPGEILCAPF